MEFRETGFPVLKSVPTISGAYPYVEFTFLCLRDVQKTSTNDRSKYDPI